MFKFDSLTKRLAFDGVLVALYVVLNRFASINTGIFRFTFDGLPIILAAVLFGYVDGVAVGGIGAFIGQLLSEYGLSVTTPLWILPAIVRGLFVGLACRFFNKKDKNLNLIIIIIISSIIVSILNSLIYYLDSVIFKYNTDAYTIINTAIRIGSGVITAILYCIVVIPVKKPLIKIISKNGVQKDRET